METVTTLFDSDLAEWEYMQEQKEKERRAQMKEYMIYYALGRNRKTLEIYQCYAKTQQEAVQKGEKYLREMLGYKEIKAIYIIEKEGAK